MPFRWVGIDFSEVALTLRCEGSEGSSRECGGIIFLLEQTANFLILL